MLIAIIGLSCVGKSAVMLQLQQRHSFKFLKNYSTRQYREEGHTKTSITEKEFSQFQSSGRLVFVNEHYGFKYAFLKADIIQAMNASNECYMIDFAIQNIYQLKAYKDIHSFILIPESLDVVVNRVLKSDRISRFDSIMNEYDKYYRMLKEGHSSKLGAYVVINVENRLDLVAKNIVSQLEKVK